jgi:phosphatidate cytidylyltransferase
VLRTRILTAILVLPLVIVATVLGGLWFFVLVTVVLTLAAIEFCQLMGRDPFRPPPAFAVALVWLLVLDAQFPHGQLLGERILGPGLAIVLFSSLIWQLAHRQGYPTADWALSIAGGLYIGWSGAYFLRIRQLPEGLWWLMTIIPITWFSDVLAYVVGSRWGRHKMTPHLSPGKTWEGWAGGVVAGTLTGTGLASVWSALELTGLTPITGLLMGLTLSALAPLGDLTISMMKRQVGADDSGSLFPGHGGALDRLDSLLWTAAIGYYLALWVDSLG